MTSDHASLEVLKSMIAELERMIETAAPLPENRSARCLELIRAAKALTDDLLSTNRA